MKPNKILLATCLSTLLSGLFTTANAAVPYHDLAITVKQPNGEKLALTIEGNTYYAEHRTRDGALVVYDNAKKGWCYAELSAKGDSLISTGILAGANAPRLAAGKTAQAGLSSEAKAVIIKTNRERMQGHAHTFTKSAPQSLAPVTGSVKGLTVMIQFPDQAGTMTATQIGNFLNGLTYTEFGNAQSVRGYFKSVSAGKLDYTNVVPAYYTAKKNKSYYTDPNQPFGSRAEELIGEALAALKAQNFDFSQLTVDANRQIMGLNFFYSGETDGGWSQGLWPHQGHLNQQFCSNTVCTNNYQITNMGSALSIGTFVHESGHLLFNWPDLYDYDGSSLGSGANFCVMGYGAVGAQSKFRPVMPNAYFRHLVGWETVTELNPALNASAPKTLSVAANGHALYRFSNPANQQEAFYLEGFAQTGQNTHVPDAGLAVWHIDPVGGNNSTEWRPYIQLEHADGKRDPENKVNYGDANDLYDGASYKSFSDTVPNALSSRGTNALWWNGTKSGLALAVGAPGANIAVTVGGSTPGNSTTYSGSLASGGTAYQPSASGFSYTGGTITGKLVGPVSSTIDFDLYLDKLSGTSWVQVAKSDGATSAETITYSATSGSYRFRVVSYTGSGSYTLTVTK